MPTHVAVYLQSMAVVVAVTGSGEAAAVQERLAAARECAARA